MATPEQDVEQKRHDAEVRRLQLKVLGLEGKLRKHGLLLPVPSRGAVASNLLDLPTPNAFELVDMLFDCRAALAAEMEATAAERALAEHLAAREAKWREALAHMQCCLPCAEGSWNDCEDGRAALELLGQAPEVQPS